MEFELYKKDLVGAEQLSTVIKRFKKKKKNLFSWHANYLLTMNKEQIFLKLIIFLTFSLQKDIAHVLVFLVKVKSSLGLG